MNKKKEEKEDEEEEDLLWRFVTSNYTADTV